MFDFFRSHRRAALRTHPFPEAWRAIVAANVPYVSTLSPEDRTELEGHVQVLLAEKKFEGCGGLELTSKRGSGNPRRGSSFSPGTPCAVARATCTTVTT